MENIIYAVIIDDEKFARDALKGMLEMYCPMVQVIGEADSVADGQSLIRKLNPQLIFLDVEMPSGTGFDVLTGLQSMPQGVIFTTAHDKYALRAIKISALDYLLKPIDRQDLINAVTKFQRNGVQITRDVWDLLRNQLDTKKEQVERLAIPSLQGYEIIKVSDIIYCEGDRNYTTFYISGRDNIVSSKTLKEYEMLLASATFIRAHQKYLVNINFVKRYLKGRTGTLIMENGKSIEVSQSKKQDVLDALGKDS
jgi:two-component system, LytTR family, response regulator